MTKIFCMRNIFTLSFFCLNFFFASAIFAQTTSESMKPTVFEQDHNTTATYVETIRYYEYLDQQSDQLQLRSYGMTDSGHPLHLAILSKDQDFDPRSIRQKGKNIF